MPAAESKPQLARSRSGGWWFRRWAAPRIMAGVTDRSMDVQALVQRLPAPPAKLVQAQQVHGGSVAIIEGVASATCSIAGCDALVTRQPGVALLIRTADCLPILLADPAKAVIGIIHAGWRGLAARLPMRVVSAFRQAYRSEPQALHVAIGPAIHACCYDVGPEFSERFGSFVRRRAGRRTCDLIGVAIHQLQRCGVPRHRIVDSGQCTGCDLRRWYSVRKEGDATGRMTSLILVRP